MGRNFAFIDLSVSGIISNNMIMRNAHVVHTWAIPVCAYLAN